MAHNAWDLHKASGGRFYLGLGSQVKAHNERRFGVPWSPPAPRMRAYIGAVRAVWHAWETETPLDFQSDAYTLTLMTPNFSPRPTGLPRIPISISAVGPAMLRLGGEVCDGVRLHPFSTRRYLDEVSIARISEGLAKAGRERRKVEVIAGGYGFIGTGPNAEAIARARAYVRFRIAFYCSTKAYWDVLRLHDLVWLGEKVNPLPRENRWSEMAEQIPEELIDLFATVVEYEALPEAIEKRYGGSADGVLLQIGPNEDVERLARCVAAIQRIPARSRATRSGLRLRPDALHRSSRGTRMPAYASILCSDRKLGSFANAAPVRSVYCSFMSQRILKSADPAKCSHSLAVRIAQDRNRYTQ